MEDVIKIELTREECRVLIARYEAALERDANLGESTDEVAMSALHKLLLAIKT